MNDFLSNRQDKHVFMIDLIKNTAAFNKQIKFNNDYDNPVFTHPDVTINVSKTSSNWVTHSQPLFYKKDQDYYPDQDGWKIHMMFIPTKKNYVRVLHTLLDNAAILPRFLFKLVPNFPVTNVNGFEVFPKTIGRFQTDPYSVEDIIQLYQQPISPESLHPRLRINGKDTNSYHFDGKQVEFEAVFPPCVVFYMPSNGGTYRTESGEIVPEELPELVDILLELFPDELTKNMTLPHYYPRMNFKLNNILYFSKGAFQNKEKSFSCHEPTEYSSFECNTVDNQYNIPKEFEESRESCQDKITEESCHALNSLSLQTADKKICKWDGRGGQCKPNPIKSIDFYVLPNQTVKSYYQAVEQEAIYNSFLQNKIPIPLEIKKQ